MKKVSQTLLSIAFAASIPSCVNSRSGSNHNQEGITVICSDGKERTFVYEPLTRYNGVYGQATLKDPSELAKYPEIIANGNQKIRLLLNSNQEPKTWKPTQVPYVVTESPIGTKAHNFSIKFGVYRDLVEAPYSGSIAGMMVLHRSDGSALFVYKPTQTEHIKRGPSSAPFTPSIYWPYSATSPNIKHTVTTTSGYSFLDQNKNPVHSLSTSNSKSMYSNSSAPPKHFLNPRDQNIVLSKEEMDRLHYISANGKSATRQDIIESQRDAMQKLNRRPPPSIGRELR